MKMWMRKGVACVLGSVLVLSLAGCSGQQTAAELIGVVGTAVSALAAFEGNAGIGTALQKDFAAAATAVANWKAGTPAQDVVEALNLVEADLNLVPLSAEDDGLITLAIGTVDQIFAFFPGAAAAPVNVPAKTLTAVAWQKTAPPGRAAKGYVVGRPVTLAKKPKNAKEFKQLWNAELARVKPGVAPIQ